MVGEWEEREFEWVEARRFVVDRRFTKGPLARMIQSCDLSRLPGGGTRICYEMRVEPSSPLGALVVPLAVGVRMRRSLERVYRAYDLRVQTGATLPARSRPAARIKGRGQRLAQIASALTSEARQPEGLVRKLCDYVLTADDLSVGKMRPYALADTWGEDRRATLDLFLHATRAGLLDFSWEVLCPHCRGSAQGKSELSKISSESHCDSCGVDFTANFDQSVELKFLPDPAVRKVTPNQYCLGGPQITPHIVVQKRLAPKESLAVSMSFPEGRYRLRTPGVAIQQAFRIETGGTSSARIDVGPKPVPVDEPVVSPSGTLNLHNTDSTERLAVLERVAWSDQAVTAAAVTSRQIFRDLFSREILRQGERISVGTMTIVFTDLKDSTRLYREIGDASAFGRVLSHFDVIRQKVAEHGGCVVKTMGDAVMAVFIHPLSALTAMTQAQAALSAPENARARFALKCSIHKGPCLAINQNERLDYFGTTVNIGSRLCALSTGSDIVVSEPVIRDPEVSELVAKGAPVLAIREDATPLRGISDAPYAYWRIAS